MRSFCNYVIECFAFINSVLHILFNFDIENAHVQHYEFKKLLFSLKLQDHESPTSSVSELMQAQFLQLVQKASHCTKQGNLELAARLYTDAIIIDPANHILYSNRSFVYQKMNQLNEALHDACKCKQLKFNWSKVR